MDDNEEKFPVELNRVVKKHVSFVHTSGELNLVERKLVNVLLLNAYDKLITEKRHEIPIKILAQMIGWSSSRAYDNLKEPLRNIKNTPIEMDLLGESGMQWTASSLLSEVSLNEDTGMVYYEYSSTMAQMLYDPEIYAIISASVQTRFKGGYTLNLYENCVRFKNVGSTGWWDLAKFRRLIGATAPTYDEFKRLSSFIIKKSVTEINKVSDIVIEPHFTYSGRKVSGVKFLIKENPQKTLFSPEDADEHQELKNTDTYKQLRKHGISERLAIMWVLQEPGRAKQVVEYVEEQDKKKLVKKTTGGLIATLMRTGAQVGESEYEQEKKAKSTKAEADPSSETNKQIAEQAKLRRKEEMQRAFDALTESELEDYMYNFLKEHQDNSVLIGQYDKKTKKFKSHTMNNMFEFWVKQKLA